MATKSGLALVIGNVQYALSNLHLINAVNDAKAVSKKLRRLGFIVSNLNDCTTEEFSRALQEFSEQLKNHQVGLFYYAGHGLQIDGKNFLTGIDTGFFDSVSVKHSSINLDEIIERMQADSLEVKILVLDACRDNPLPKMRNVSNAGLAPIYAPQGTIIAFSTSPGERARDFGIGKHSIYTGAFLEHINDVNIPIEEFFKRVRTTVYAHSKGAQTSWEHTSLIGDFFFNSGQLIHSVNLPYKEEHIADGLFVSSGSEFDEMIVGMKSHDWYQQGPAFTKFRNMKIDSISNSELFLVGRNFLQMAIGGERGAERIMNNKLDDILSNYFSEEENHLLNGILFELYFNSKGMFRETNFKDKFITEISYLQKNKKYKKSFDFITAQLRPFSDYIFYLPTSTPKTLPLEIHVERYVGEEVDKRKTAWKILSIKNNNVELLHSSYLYSQSSIKDFFLTKLANVLSAPKQQLRVTWNEDVQENSFLVYPWEFRLSRSQPDESD
jgi:hypothetical protein